MSPSDSHRGRLPRAHHAPTPVVDDGDTDDRWTSAVLLSYCGLLLVVGLAALYALG